MTFAAPAPKKAGWDIERQVREEVFFAVIEAKDNCHFVGAGMPQALGYAKLLDIPVAFSSNGDGFVEHDRTAYSGDVERNLTLCEYSPAMKSSGNATRSTKGSSHHNRSR